MCLSLDILSKDLGKIRHGIFGVLIKLVVSPASTMTKMQGCCVLMTGEAPLAANLVTRLMLEHLTRDSAAQVAPKASFWLTVRATFQMLDLHFEQN